MNHVADDIAQAFEYGYKKGKHDTIRDCNISTWIPVTERLPEERKTYLVKVESPHDPIRIYHFDPKNGNYSDNLWRNGDLSYVEDCFVTHWMPLPKPPKEE